MNTGSSGKHVVTEGIRRRQLTEDYKGILNGFHRLPLLSELSFKEQGGASFTPDFLSHSPRALLCHKHYYYTREVLPFFSHQIESLSLVAFSSFVFLFKKEYTECRLLITKHVIKIPCNVILKNVNLV